MKQIVFEDMYCWSVFNDQRQIDFNGHLWVRREGNVLIDPVPMRTTCGSWTDWAERR